LAGTLTFNNLTVVNTGTNTTSGQFRVQTSPITVNGDLNINGGIMWVAGQAAKTMNVAGNLNIAGGELNVVTAANAGIVNVTGNLNISSGTLKLDSGSTTGTLNVKGDVSIIGGTLDLASSSGVGTVSDTGDFSHTGGIITETGSTTTSGIKFVKAGTQTYISGGTVSNNVNFTVNSGSTLQMADASTVVSGGGTFTLSSGATLGITSSAGITSSGATGNIQVTGTRTFNAGANYIYNGTGAQVTGNGLPASLTGNVTINNASGVTLSVTTTTSGILTMSAGNIALGGNTLTLGTAAATRGTLSYTSGFITGSGTFKRWFNTSAVTLPSATGQFPMGVGTNNRNLWVAGTPTTGGTVSVQYTDANTTSAISFTELSNTFVNRYDASWTVATANSFAGSSLSLQIQGSGIPGISNIEDLTISGPAAAAAGSPLATSGTTSDPVISRNGLTAATLASTAFYIASTTSSALPVEMTSFTAVLQGTSALLNWATATEMNNSGFQIERSVEGSGVWAEVAFVNGAGTSSSPKTYSYEDKNLAPGKYVYRIKQIDNDGAYKYYTASMPKVDAGVANTFQLDGNFPNPFNPTTNIQFSVPQDGYASLKVYNMLGQEVATLFAGMAKAGHYIPATFNASRLASGIYFARLQYSGKSLVQRMLLTK
jgi:hypothetical protein